MTTRNPYLDGKTIVREDALFDVEMNTRRGVGTLRLDYDTPQSKIGHYRRIEIALDRNRAAWIADALHAYVESEEADVRKLRERLEGTNRS